MIPHWATPGRKVVCVKDYSGRLIHDINGDSWPSSRWGYTTPVLGETYTLRKAFLTRQGKAAAYVVEIRNDHFLNVFGEEIAFSLAHFRPVITLEEDMLTFASWLNTVPSEIKETTNA